MCDKPCVETMLSATSHVYKIATEPGLPASMISTNPLEEHISCYMFMKLALSDLFFIYY